MLINGFCDEKFAAVYEEFENNFQHRGDVGGSFCATVEGEFVVDIWGGYANEERTKAWHKDTMVCVFSCAKLVYFIATAMLVERGLLDYQDKVSKYWPEYGQKGKKNTTIAHLLTHSAGLPGFGIQLSLEEICDWNFVIKVLEQQEPWWVPGTVTHYHADTQGFLVGEVVRRITGISLGNFIREFITNPLKADFFIGLKPNTFKRVADTLMFPPRADSAQSQGRAENLAPYLKNRIFGTPKCLPRETNSFLWRTAEVPGSNGHGNARSLARISSLIANNGPVDGVQLAGPEIISRMLEPQMMMGDKMLGMGPGLNSDRWFGPNNVDACWWGGFGGSTNWVDRTNKVSISYAMNQLNYDIIGGPRGGSLHRSFYHSLLGQQ